jgi:hypothetical protein
LILVRVLLLHFLDLAVLASDHGASVLLLGVVARGRVFPFLVLAAFLVGVFASFLLGLLLLALVVVAGFVLRLISIFVVDTFLFSNLHDSNFVTLSLLFCLIQY